MILVPATQKEFCLLQAKQLRLAATCAYSSYLMARMTGAPSITVQGLALLADRIRAQSELMDKLGKSHA